MRENGIEQPPQEESVVALQDYDPDVAIIQPTLGGYIGDVVQIDRQCAGWLVSAGVRLRYRSARSGSPIGDERSGDVENGLLGEFDTTGWKKGRLRCGLTVNRGDGPRVWTTPVTIDNTPPTVVVSEPKPDQLYVMEDDEQININVLVNDTWAVDRVEYIIDASSFATRTVAPYNERWPIVMRNVEQIEVDGTENWLAFESDDPDIQPGRARPFCGWLRGGTHEQRRLSGGPLSR